MILECKQENKFIELDIRYCMGGFNNWTGQAQERCYNLHITPVEKFGSGFIMGAFTGIIINGEPLIRKSKQSQQQALDYFNKNINQIKTIIIKVCEKNNLELKENLDNFILKEI
jgi:hypothetical protein